MKINTDEIKIWETVEVERSASEALKKNGRDLRIKDGIIERYASPPAATPYALEYAYHLLGDARGQKVLD